MPLGICNKIANKGAISISFNIKKRNVIILNCHLEAHEENRTARLEQWHQIYQRLICTKYNEPTSFIKLGCCDDASGALNPRLKKDFYTRGI